jgi:hypothetical protein
LHYKGTEKIFQNECSDLTRKIVLNGETFLRETVKRIHRIQDRKPECLLEVIKSRIDASDCGKCILDISFIDHNEKCNSKKL